MQYDSTMHQQYMLFEMFIVVYSILFHMLFCKISRQYLVYEVQYYK